MSGLMIVEWGKQSEYTTLKEGISTSPFEIPS